jgi:hypothetical protein
MVLTSFPGRPRFRKGTDDARPSRRDSSFVITFAPNKPVADATTAADDAGHHIVALLQKASDRAKAECQRALDIAHRISSELRDTEERARKFEAEAHHFRDRAARAEEWLVRIESELQQTFFQNK